MTCRSLLTVSRRRGGPPTVGTVKDREMNGAKTAAETRADTLAHF
jgi:hypothetical protein